MTPDQFKQFLRRHKLTQAEFAGLVGHSARTGQYWATHAVPGSVATMAELIDRRPELLGLIREMADERRDGS